MAPRPGFVVDHFTPADGGKPPNRYHPVVSAQVRCNWPPLATDEQIREALMRAYEKAVAEVERMRA